MLVNPAFILQVPSIMLLLEAMENRIFSHKVVFSTSFLLLTDYIKALRLHVFNYAEIIAFIRANFKRTSVQLEKIMSRASSDFENSVFFFHYLRFVMVVFVVLFHASISYSNLVPWWFSHDVSSGLFDLFILLCDVFMMPILFFIAGYFTIPSLQKRGGKDFLKNKVKRLGIPFIFGIIFLAPIMPYLRTFKYSTEPITLNSYVIFWTDFLISAGDINAGFITSLYQFNQYHFWFIGVLLTFYLIFTCLYNTRYLISLTSPIPSTSRKENSIPSLKLLLLFGIVTSLGYFSVISFISDARWFSLWNIVMFQPARLVLYVAYFSLGIYAFSNQWFIDGKTFRFPTLWVISSLILMVGTVLTIQAAMRGHSVTMLLVYSFCRSFLCLALLVSTVSLFARFMNYRSKRGRQVMANSYTIYIVHLPIVVIFQFFFTNWELYFIGAAWIKFIAVSSLSLVISYAISAFCIQPFFRSRYTWNISGR